MSKPANVHLYLCNRPENVLLVREMLAGAAETVGVDRGSLDDVQTAVTEACNNVVLHAYKGREGPLEVEFYAHPNSIEVVVRDSGVGMNPPTRNPDQEMLGLGLPVIQALVHRVQFTDAQGSGSEVRMQFATPCARAPETLLHDDPPPAIGKAELAHTTGVSIAPTCLAQTVLPRVLSVLAVQAHFSTDRISDVQLFTDALVAQAKNSIDTRPLSVAVSTDARNLQLRIGPLKAGSSQPLLDCAVEGLGPVTHALIDDHRVSSAGADEVLIVGLVDRR